MDPAIAVVVAAVLSAGASWFASRVAGRASRNNAMLEWAKQLQAGEQAARREAQESRDRAERIKDEAESDVAQLRTEIDTLSVKLRDAQRMADRLTDTLASVQSEVWRPEPNIEAVRRLLGRPASGLNGH